MSGIIIVAALSLTEVQELLIVCATHLMFLQASGLSELTCLLVDLAFACLEGARVVLRYSADDLRSGRGHWHLYQVSSPCSMFPFLYVSQVFLC
jgi:hypothetical protein